MTRITKIEMKGFKSFANKTELVFGDHFNCVLGPNGSGKSNVLDALCFVLGKSSAKSLRAEKSANLIYNGGKKKNPAKQGEVSIWFDNHNNIFPIEENYVKLTRVIQQSGNSKYKINDKTVTRNQMIELLSIAKIDPNGYNIILQGDIVRLIEMTGNERRQIIEEISGISIYEEKKNKAMRELDKVETQMKEAEIILAERQTYLKELKKERDQAMKFKDLDDKIKRNKATLVHNKLTSKRKKQESFEKKITDNQESIKKTQEKIDTLKEKIAEHKKGLDNISKEIESKGEKEQVRIHKLIEQLKIDLAVDKQRIDTCREEINKVEERKASLHKTKKELEGKVKMFVQDREDLEKKIKQREKDIEAINLKIEQFKKKNKLEDAADVDQEMESIDKKADVLAEEINKLREKQQQLFREKDKIEIQLESIDEKIQQVDLLQREHKEQLTQLKSFKEKFKEATLSLNKHLNEASNIASQLQTARAKLVSRQETAAKLHARNAGIKEGIQGSTAVSKIIEQKNKIKGIFGTVTELGSVSSKYALAMEIAAANRVSSIVVENDAVAEKCINHLKQNKYGVATFLPLNKLRSPTISAEAKSLAKKSGVHGLAVDLISYDNKFSNVFQYVFGSTLVVDDIATARKIGIGKIRMVTLTGDLVETSGAMRGGFVDRKKKGVGFSQKELLDEIKQIDAELADLQAVVASLEKKQQTIEDTVVQLRKDKADYEGEIIKLEKTLHIKSDETDASKENKKKHTQDLKKLDKESDALMDTINTKNQALAALKIEKQKLRDKINQLRNPALLAELNTFEEKKQEYHDEIIESKNELKNIKSHIESVIGPEEENIKKIVKQHDKEIEDFTKESAALKKKIAENGKQLKEYEKQQETFYAQFKELFKKRTDLSDEMQKLEGKTISEEEVIRRKEQQNNTVSIEHAAVKAEIAGLEEEYTQYEDVALYKNKSEEDIKLEIRDFERMVENIGAVNMKALEIYERVENEYDELIEKKKKLVEERETILVMINEVDSKKKDLFMKTFDVINQNFQTIFESLSSKGRAFMELEDAKDPFNGGLTLKVRLTGKKFMDIRGLSGGEKTLTALAFLFAVQEHEPASFYVLDEVDAALDKHNSEKLSNLIEGYSDKAQYIIISHNDALITSAETLYGVSMNEHGISKITSLKI